MYFNQVPYGGTAWGIEAAAQTYFNKRTKELTLAPKLISRRTHRFAYYLFPLWQQSRFMRKRQKEVLTRMVALGYISPKQAQAAEKEELIFERQQTAIHAPHFVVYIKDLLAQKYGLPMLEKGGLNITTSLDLKPRKWRKK